MKNVETEIKNIVDGFNRLHSMKRELVTQKIALKKQPRMYVSQRQRDGVERQGRREVPQDGTENGAKGLSDDNGYRISETDHHLQSDSL